MQSHECFRFKTLVSIFFFVLLGPRVIPGLALTRFFVAAGILDGNFVRRQFGISEIGLCHGDSLPVNPFRVLFRTPAKLVRQHFEQPFSPTIPVFIVSLLSPLFNRKA